MDFQTKRHYKKRAKQYFVLAYETIIAWALFLLACVVLIIVTPPVTNHNSKGDFWMMLLFISPLFIGLTFAIFGQYFLDKRRNYKAQILEYRQRKFFTQTMNFITSGKLNEAIDVYTDLVTKHEYRRFLYPYFLCEFLHSTDENQRQKGEEKLAVVLKAYNPNDINFQS